METNRDLIIRLVLDEAEQAKFKGRNALVIPVSDAEEKAFRQCIIVCHEALGGLAVDMDAVIAQVQSFPDAGEILKGLEAWRNLVEGLHARIEAVGSIIGRARLVGAGVGESDPVAPGSEGGDE
ncbi:MAG: hypothetical protein ACK4L4_05870 [Gemmobacter sp.]